MARIIGYIYGDIMVPFARAIRSTVGPGPDTITKIYDLLVRVAGAPVAIYYDAVLPTLRVVCDMVPSKSVTVTRVANVFVRIAGTAVTTYSSAIRPTAGAAFQRVLAFSDNMARIFDFLVQITKAPLLIFREVVLTTVRSVCDKVLQQYNLTIKPLAIVFTNGIMQATSLACTMARAHIPGMTGYDVLAATVMPVVYLLLIFAIAVAVVGYNNAVVAMLTLAVMATIMLLLSPGCMY